MNIEISDAKYWKELNYYDGLLYCSLLEIDGKNDWRMLKNSDEWYDTMDETWFIDDINRYDEYYLNIIYWIVPVRDKND